MVGRRPTAMATVPVAGGVRRVRPNEQWPWVWLWHASILQQASAWTTLTCLRHAEKLGLSPAAAEAFLFVFELQRTA